LSKEIAQIPSLGKTKSKHTSGTKKKYYLMILLIIMMVGKQEMCGKALLSV
jgi:hypothetical protein